MIDLAQKVFGFLTVMERCGGDYYGINWRCKCACGNIRIVRGINLRRGDTKSCGCKKGNHAVTIKHGHANRKNKKASPEYYTWLAMMARCRNPKTQNFYLYGGRGISVCERWLVFENFLSDMGLRPSNKHSIDRYPNKNGNYEPSNCRWATQKEQMRNTRRNVFIEYDGRLQILEEWASELNADPSNINRRIKSGQDFEEIYKHYKKVRKRIVAK